MKSNYKNGNKSSKNPLIKHNSLINSYNKLPKKFKLYKESKINLINANRVRSNASNKFKACKKLFKSPKINQNNFNSLFRITRI